MTADRDPAEGLVREALAALPATRTLAQAPLHRVRGGLSNHAWRADSGGRCYFVRLSGPDAERLGVDRKSECALVRAAASAAFAPAVLACEPSRGLLVMDFVSAPPWRREDSRRLRNVRRIGQVLSDLHRLPPPPGVRRISFKEQAASLEVQLAGTEAVEPALRDAVAAAHEALASRGQRVATCHNDLHHLNVLDDGERLWLVDWEYGGCGEPLMDLASFLCQHESSPRERQCLLAAYGETERAPPDLLDAACTVFDYVQWLWYRLWVARGRDAGGEYSARATAIADRLRSGAA